MAIEAMRRIGTAMAEATPIAADWVRVARQFRSAMAWDRELRRTVRRADREALHPYSTPGEKTPPEKRGKADDASGS